MSTVINNRLLYKTITLSSGLTEYSALPVRLCTALVFLQQWNGVIDLVVFPVERRTQNKHTLTLAVFLGSHIQPNSNVGLLSPGVSSSLCLR